LRFLWIIAVVVVMPLGGILRAKDSQHAQQSTLDGHLLWGNCILKNDPGDRQNNTWPALCVKPRVSSQVYLRQDVGDKNQLLNYARVYAGFHLLEYASLHGDWSAERIFTKDPLTNKTIFIDRKQPNEFFLQLGNVAVNRYRASIGNFRIPFGINHRPLMEVIDEILKDDKYWNSPRWAARMTYDTLISSQYDVSFSTTKNPVLKTKNETEADDVRAVSARMMFDIAAIEGFRFVFSGYGDTVGERRGGAGFVTTTAKGDTTAFEWIRLLIQPARDSAYDQLFRLSYSGAFRADTRWVAEYEDEMRSYRLLTVGCDFNLPDYGLFRVAFSYRGKAQKSDRGFLVITSGMQLSL
jgi:hypothetical protein